MFFHAPRGRRWTAWVVYLCAFANWTALFSFSTRFQKRWDRLGEQWRACWKYWPRVGRSNYCLFWSSRNRKDFLAWVEYYYQAHWSTRKHEGLGIRCLPPRSKHRLITTGCLDSICIRSFILRFHINDSPLPDHQTQIYQFTY